MAEEDSLSSTPMPYNRAMLEGRAARWIAIAIIAIVGAIVYSNSLQGPFIFDDSISIVESENIRSLWPLTQSLSAEAGSGASGRPIVALSLALNYALGGLEVFGYHLFNVILHILTGLILFGFVRRCLLRTELKDAAQQLSFASALIWIVHPLNTDALNHVITRQEVLLAGFYLLTLYAADRSFTGKRAARWGGLAVAACAGAMLSKEIAVSAPLLVLAYDRTFVSGDFKSAFAQHKKLYFGLASTWILLALAISSGDRGATVGFGRDISSLDYLRTQAQAIPHYLRLSLFPQGLALDYSGWPPLREWSPALLPGAGVIALFLATLVAFIRKRPEGFAGLLFFAVLAPSSSFIPLTGEWIAEHRMYLPLTAITSVLVAWGFSLCKRFAGSNALLLQAVLLFAIVSPLAYGTVQRNRDYKTARGIWEDTLVKYPENARAHDNLAVIDLEAADYQAALVHAEAALRIDPQLDTVSFNLGTILMQLGQAERATEHLLIAESLHPNDPVLHGNLGVVLMQTGSKQEAERHLLLSLKLAPSYMVARRNLALLLRDSGRSAESLPHFQRLLREHADPRILEIVANILATDPDPKARNGAEALRMAQALIQGNARNPQFYDLLGTAYAELGRFEDAQQAAKKALEGAIQLGQAEFEAAVRARLELYSNGMPYRSLRNPF
ncbi:MAG: Flp pilus assembly protein TadD [Planctomycetota bacterium]|jgi:Flp pilus assembly protein TadD